MTTTQPAAIDVATIERLSRGFHDTFRNLAARDDVFSADVFFDLNMPVWRFQLQGREAWESQLRKLPKVVVRCASMSFEPSRRSLGS